MNARIVLLLTLLVVDDAMARHPTVLTFLTTWSTLSGTWLLAGAPLW